MGEVATRRRGGITQYDPEKGLKSISVLEAAEKHWTRAKDIKQLRKAVEEKLKAQREYILWRDSVVTQGQRTDLSPDEDKLPSADPGNKVAYKWRQQLKDPEAFERSKELSIERCVQDCEARSDAATQQSRCNEWYTPADYLTAARTVMGGIDLDPASCEEANGTVQATEFFDEEANGLSKTWYGRVWLNPPYGKVAAGFVQKLASEIGQGNVEQAIVLVNSNTTDTKWFKPLWDGVLCFTDHRIDFNSPDFKHTSSTHGSVFVYFGANDRAFAKEFRQFGYVVRRFDDHQ